MRTALGLTIRMSPRLCISMHVRCLIPLRCMSAGTSLRMRGSPRCTYVLTYHCKCALQPTMLHLHCLRSEDLRQPPTEEELQTWAEVKAESMKTSRETALKEQGASSFLEDDGEEADGVDTLPWDS